MSVRRIIGIATVVLSIVGVSVAASSAADLSVIAASHARLAEKNVDSSATERGEQIFRSTCAACHGSNGAGAPQSTVGFAVPLPDFTDCRATSPESAVDWMAVIRDGGPVRGFSRIMPAFRDLLTPDQIRNVAAYIRSLCTNRAWPHGEFNVPLADITEKAFPEDEFVLTGTVETSGPGAVTNHLIYEQRFGTRSQLEVDAPFGFINRPSSAWAGGLGDVSVAAKHVFVANPASGTILSGLAGIILPTGDQSLALGSGTTSYEGYLLGAQLLPANSFFQFQGGIEIPRDLALSPRTISFSGVLGKTIPFGPISRIWTPMIELAATHDIVSGAPVEWSTVPQFQISLSALQHVRGSVGVNIPLNERDMRHAQILAYLLWDTADGPFFTGWKGWCPGCQR
ncbi:MAG: c-type cytochrome [Gemmatimonadaceae bacterium]